MRCSGSGGWPVTAVVPVLNADAATEGVEASPAVAAGGLVGSRIPVGTPPRPAREPFVLPP